MPPLVENKIHEPLTYQENICDSPYSLLNLRLFDIEFCFNSFIIHELEAAPQEEGEFWIHRERGHREGGAGRKN